MHSPETVFNLLVDRYIKAYMPTLTFKLSSVNGGLKMISAKFPTSNQKQLILAPALFDQCHLDSLNDGSSWQGDSLALTEDEVTVLMEEIEEEQDLKLLDIR